MNIIAELRDTEARISEALENVRKAIASLEGEGVANEAKAFSQDEALRSLTEREREVFDLLGDDKAISEIAAKLDLSAKTISANQEALKRKFGVNKAHELRAIAMAAKLVKTPI